MEVHHHSHPSTSSGHRKKWTHYFWEFLMLFLAVFYVSRGIASVLFSNNGLYTRCKRQKVKQRAVGSIHLKSKPTHATKPD